MERHHIEVFLALAEELHFGRTADRLRLSQARVSQSIKDFEREIGAPLFERTSRRVDLTPLGSQLRDQLEPADAAVREALADAQASARGKTATLRVGFLGPVAQELVNEVAASFRADWPRCGLELRETQIADPVAPLRDGRVDLLLTQLPVREAGITAAAPLIEEERVLAVAADHPLARGGSVCSEDLASVEFLRPSGTPSRDWEENYQPWKTPSGATIKRSADVGTMEELLAAVAAGFGACTVAAWNRHYNPRRGVAYVPITDEEPFEFGFVWRTTDTSPALRAFVALANGLVRRRGGPAAIPSAMASSQR